MELSSKAFKSNHAVIRIPPFSVTGTVFAVGKIHRTFSCLGVAICVAAPAHPRPVSPNPCNMMHALVATDPSRGSTTIGEGYDDASIAPTVVPTPLVRTARAPYVDR